jgi:hypothetical protein
MYSSLIVYIIFTFIIFVSIYIQYTKFDLTLAYTFPFSGEQKNQSTTGYLNCFHQNVKCNVERDCFTCLNTELKWHCDKDAGICLPRDTITCPKNCHRKYGTYVIVEREIDGQRTFECICKCVDNYHYGPDCNSLRFNVRHFDVTTNQIYCNDKHIPYSLQLNYNTKFSVCFPEHMKDVLNSQLHVEPIL